VWAVAIGLGALVGCSGEPKRVPVKAVVRLDGQPMELVIVCFVWADAVSDPSKAGFGRGISDASGRLSVVDMHGKEGMWPGRYKVTFEKYVTAQGKPIPLNAKPDEVYGGARNMMPKKYHDPDTTDVVVEVTDKGLDTVFELRSK
jgi:hypothetical protein